MKILSGGVLYQIIFCFTGASGSFCHYPCEKVKVQCAQENSNELLVMRVTAFTAGIDWKIAIPVK